MISGTRQLELRVTSPWDRPMTSTPAGHMSQEILGSELEAYAPAPVVSRSPTSLVPWDSEVGQSHKPTLTIAGEVASDQRETELVRHFARMVTNGYFSLGHFREKILA